MTPVQLPILRISDCRLPIADFVLPSGILTLSRVVTIVEGRKLAIGNWKSTMEESAI
jgi:hypothetical protein